MLNTFADISSNNPLPDLAAYADAGHKHLCRKVTEGTGYRWFDGDTVVAQAHARGLRVGHYHWLRPDFDALTQAQFFVASVQGSFKPGDWLMTDFERTYDNGQTVSDVSDAFRANQLRTFNAYVKSRFPLAPLLVYTGNWYLDGMPLSAGEVRKWPVVMSNYDPITILPNPHQLNYVAWQFSETATVPGFSAPVDYNRWLVDPTPTPPTPVVSSEEDEMLLISRQTRGAYPVFVAGSVHTVIAHASTAQALLAAGAKAVTVSDDDYTRIRRGAVAK
jgi:GH25 family lysozyme M1 (1,4-beta-N-acetylmuramidase)